MSEQGGQGEDFAALLRGEILAAKRKRQETVEAAGGKKYLKKGDLERTLGKETGAERGGPAGSQETASREGQDSPTLAAAPKEMRPGGADLKEDEAGEGLARSAPALEGQEPEVPPKNRRQRPDVCQVGAMETESIHPKEDFSKITPLILLFLKRLLHEQEASLDARPETERSSQEGRLASSIFVQSNGSLKVLFKLLRRNTVPKDILKRLAEICSFMQQREYVQANDAYLKLAIGNAPWPIGVTAVGIHERSAQEKIKTNQIARTCLKRRPCPWS